MAELTFRGTLQRYLPSWLKPRPGKTYGFRYLYTVASVIDASVERVLQGVLAKMPGLGTPTALPYLFRDRRMTRGYAEPDDVAAQRLIPFRQFHQTQGNPFTLMRMVRAYLYPHKPLMRVVNNQATWYTLTPDDEETTVRQAGNWDWDGNTDLRARFWLIIYPEDSDVPLWTPEGAWGDGEPWGDGGVWGSTITENQVQTIRAIIDEWRSGTGLLVNVILAFDNASFDPEGSGAGYPDGTWGSYSKNVGGVQVPARLTTARYVQGAA